MDKKVCSCCGETIAQAERTKNDNEAIINILHDLQNRFDKVSAKLIKIENYISELKDSISDLESSSR